ncbi:hypothetical protein PSTG_02675 [Puccinia striiformis f. sp. tritici PST-78]|uniref:Protein OS-9 homolog n=1 Tax=Puccinia striiformis f. sp. tritici PST-78 TaxID=1165861 RepID=A0A0L0VYJ1_9BASI|nr:hypothetical protein PSTG_02675 [Puccinia striiformis f. sp. tritici PST-78]
MTSRTHFTPNALLLILNLLHHATSLSSHSPPDPLAYPKYSVSLDGWDHAINNLTATAILNDLQSESKDDAISLLNYKSFDQNDQAELRHTLMRTASGQAFLCALPAIPSLAPPSIIASTSKSPAALPDLPSPETETEDLDRKKDRQKIEQDGLKNGLNLISSLKERCIYTRMGWFTYSFCYGKGEIKQFHAIMMYMDKAAAEEARSSRSTTSAEGKTGAGSEAVGGTKSDSKTDQADSKKTSTHAPGNDLEEIAKALKESLGALLRDLKATENDENDPARRKHNPNQNNRVNNNIKPKSLAEVLAAFKSGDLKSSKLKGSNKNHLLQDQDGQDRSSARNEDHIKKLSSENHAKLRDMYQSTFSLKSSDSHLTSSDDKSDSKSDSDKDDE